MIQVRTKNNVLVQFCVIPLFLGLCACRKDVQYAKDYSFENGWVKTDTLNFEFDIQDTLSSYDLYVNFINNNKYPYANVYLFSNFADENQTEIKDTLQYVLALPNGDWLANHTGNKYKRKLLLKHQFKFNASGRHQIQLIQGMRKDTLQGIEKVGMILDKSSTNGIEKNE